MPDDRAAQNESRDITRFRRGRALVISGIAVFGVSLGIKGCLTDTKRWTESVHLLDGRVIQVDHLHKAHTYFGSGHGLGFGGGEISHLISFQFDGADYRFESLYTPIVLHPVEDNFCLAVFDRETDSTKSRFRFYLLHPRGSQEEVLGERFPKQLAIQNMWLKKENGFTYWPDGSKRVIDEYQIVHDMDPGDYEFRDSLTAKLWERLELGQEYYATEGRDQSEDFLRDYKARYIARPVATQPTSQAADSPGR